MTYALLDSGDFQKLEQVGPFRIVRPSPQAVWKPRLGDAEWNKVDAHYERFTGGDGKWTKINKLLPSSWVISIDEQKFVIKLTDFGHLGIFPEQHRNWRKLGDTIARFRAQNLPDAVFRVLNLFAYTGGSTLAAARAGAQVAHIDASKTSVAWARENAAANQGEQLPIRWLTEDAVKFVDREIRRGQVYQGLILDPPSYGRGPDGEVWKIEDHMVPLIRKLAQLTDKTLAFVLLSSHSHGYTPLALANLINSEFKVPIAAISSEEMTLNERDSERVLPSGASALYLSKPL